MRGAFDLPDLIHRHRPVDNPAEMSTEKFANFSYLVAGVQEGIIGGEESRTIPESRAGGSGDPFLTGMY